MHHARVLFTTANVDMFPPAVPLAGKIVELHLDSIDLSSTFVQMLQTANDALDDEARVATRAADVSRSCMLDVCMYCLRVDDGHWCSADD